MQSLDDLYDRLSNFKFESAIKYLPEAGLEKEDQDLVKYLAQQFGNTGWIMGDFGFVLVNAALRSLPGYVEWSKKNEVDLT